MKTILNAESTNAIEHLKDLNYIVVSDDTRLTLIKNRNYVFINQNMITISNEGQSMSIDCYNPDFESSFCFHSYNDNCIRFMSLNRTITLKLFTSSNEDLLLEQQCFLILISNHIDEILKKKNIINMKKIKSNLL